MVLVIEISFGFFIVCSLCELWVTGKMFLNFEEKFQDLKVILHYLKEGQVVNMTTPVSSINAVQCSAVARD